MRSGCNLAYIRTRSSWLYVDLDMAAAMSVALVCAALQRAIVQRNPALGLTVHSDRGSQLGFKESSQHQPDKPSIVVC